MPRPPLSEIFGGAPDPRPPLAAIFGAEPGPWEADPASPSRERRQRPAGGWEYRAKAPDFSGVQSSSSTVSAAQVAKRQQMAGARRIAQEQERPVAPTLSGEEGVNPTSRPPTGPESTAVLGDLARRFAGGVRGGMTEGADFLLHLPETVGRGLASPIAEVLQEDQRRRFMVGSGRQRDIDEAVHPNAWAPLPANAPPARPLPEPEGLTALGVPPIVEETFQNAREERERRSADAPSYLRTEGDPAYSAGRLTGNLLDPTMLLLEEATAGKIASRLARREAGVAGRRGMVQAAEGLTEEEARMLARRDAFMHTQPPADVSVDIPGASRWGSESSIGQVGQHADDAAQSEALGMRASREDAKRLAAGLEAPGRAGQPFHENADEALRALGVEPTPRGGDPSAKLKLQTPRWAASPEDGFARLGEFADRHRGRALSPEDLPFQVDEMPLIRWEQEPGAYNPRRQGGHFWLLGDSTQYHVPAESTFDVGGSLPRAVIARPKNPLITGRPNFSGGKSVGEAEGAFFQRVQNAGHDAVVMIGKNGIEVVTFPQTELVPRDAESMLSRLISEGKNPELLKRAGASAEDLAVYSEIYNSPPRVFNKLFDQAEPGRDLVAFAEENALPVEKVRQWDAFLAKHVDPRRTRVGGEAYEAGFDAMPKPAPFIDRTVVARLREAVQSRQRPSLEEIFAAEPSQQAGRNAGMPELQNAGILDTEAPRIVGAEAPKIPDAWDDLGPKKSWADPSPIGLTTGTKNEVTNAERAARGLPEVEALGRKSSGENWLAAKAAFEADPQAARDLASHVAGNPRPLTGMENDLLLHDRMKLTVDHLDALDAEAQALAAGDTEGVAMAKIRRTSLESAMQVNDAAAKRSGTAWHESGMARQKLIAEDYSPLRLTTRAKVAAAEGGRELPEAVRQQLVDTAQQLEAAQAKLAGYEERVSQMEAERAVKAVQRDVARAGRSGARRGDAAALDAEYSDLSKRFAAISNTPRAGLDPELAALVAKMARNRVQRGAKGLAEVVDAIYQDIRPHVEGLEPRDVRDAISGYGVTRTHPARSEAVLELARIKQEARTLSALEDAQAAGRPAAELDALQRKVDQISGGTALPGRGPASDAERLVATKARLARREKELTQQLAEGYFPKNARRPLALDPDAVALQGQVEGLKRKAESIIRREELRNRSFPEKAMDMTAAWGRFLKLSGTATVQKIGAAAAQRALVFKPLEEFLGAGLSRMPILKEVAKEASIEGGGSVKALAKSYAGFFGKQARAEMAAGFKGQEEGAFSLAHGSVHPEKGVPAWMEYPGRVHAGLKAPAKIAAYEYAMEKQAQHFLSRGEAEMLRDPAAIATMKARAYEYAQRDIFMGDNALSDLISSGLRDRPGQRTAAKVGKTVGKVLMPIQKVPTSYAIEATHYVAGLPKGAIRVGKAYRMGLKATKDQAERDIAGIVKAGLEKYAESRGTSVADEADRIMMNFRKGTLGAGLIALGATGVVEVGGYYRPGEHRGEGELHPGQVRIGGVDSGIVLPHNLLHHPAIEALQVGGTIFRAKTLGEGITDSAWGLAEQVPFLEEPLSAARAAMYDRQGTRFLGSVARGMTIPPDAQRLARVMDQKEEPTAGEAIGQFLGFGGLEAFGLHVPEIETVRRKPRGNFLERLRKEELLGIPGLRQRAGGYQEEDAEP